MTAENNKVNKVSLDKKKDFPVLGDLSGICLLCQHNQTGRVWFLLKNEEILETFQGADSRKSDSSAKEMAFSAYFKVIGLN